MSTNNSSTSTSRTSSEPQLMDSRQEKYLNWLITPPHERIPSSQQKYCEENQIDPTTVRRWQKKPWFIKEWDRRVEELQGSPERTQRILDALYDKGVDGDVRAAKLYLEATNRLNPHQSGGASSKGNGGMADLSDSELDELIGKMAEREKSQRQLKAI